MLLHNDIKILVKNSQLIQSDKQIQIKENGVDLLIGNEIHNMDKWRGKKYQDVINPYSDNLLDFYSTSKIPEKGYKLKPKTFYIVSTHETVNMTNNLTGLCCLRSTVARLGIIAAPCMVDVGYKGKLSIIIFYGGEIPLIIKSFTPFIHLVFFQTKLSDIQYAGYYCKQNQIGLPKNLKTV